MICDAHVHFFSPAFFDKLGAQLGLPAEGRPAAVVARAGWQDPESVDALADRWVAELRRAYEERRLGSAGPLTLDLRDVTFIDRAGIALFDEIYADVTVINCSLFAAEQLRTVIARHDAVRR